MPVFYLYEVIDNDEWLSALLEKCKELIIEELEKAGLNKDDSEKDSEEKGASEQRTHTEGGDEPEPAKPRPPNP